MVDWIFFSLFNALYLPGPCGVYTYIPHTHNSTWLMSYVQMDVSKFWDSTKPGIKYSTSNTVHAFVYHTRNSTIHCNSHYRYHSLMYSSLMHEQEVHWLLNYSKQLNMHLYLLIQTIVLCHQDFRNLAALLNISMPVCF